MDSREPQDLREDPGGFIDRAGKSSFAAVELEQTLQARAHSIVEDQLYKGSPDRRRLKQQTQSEREDGNELKNSFTHYADHAGGAEPANKADFTDGGRPASQHKPSKRPGLAGIVLDLKQTRAGVAVDKKIFPGPQVVRDAYSSRPNTQLARQKSGGDELKDRGLPPRHILDKAIKEVDDPLDNSAQESLSKTARIAPGSSSHYPAYMR